MEQIIITHKDGTTLKLQSKANVSAITRAEQTVELLGQDIVNISVLSAKKLTFLLGDKITIVGRDYTMNTPATERKLSETQFIYDLQFEGVQYDMIRAAYSVNVDTTSNEIQDINGDSLTGDLKRFLDVLISNLNRVFPDKWVLGTYPTTTETITETFSDTDNCLSVLQGLCSEDKYNTEFHIAIAENGTRTLNVGATGATMAYTFEYGKGKGIYELTRQKISSSNIVTRLNVFGSSKNIMTSKYRAFKLCLPGKSKSQSYLENDTAIAKYGVWEGTKNFEDIYPHRKANVTALGADELTFTDNSMDFDLNAKDGNGNTLYLIAGTSPKVHFNSGNLAGYDFEVTSYKHATKTFTLKPQTDENGYTFPSPTSAAFKFAIDDEYTITDIYMPQSYVDTAEEKLATAGADYLAKYSQPLVSYGLTVDNFFLRDIIGMEVESNLIWAGDYIPIKDTDLEVDKTIRVKGFSRDLMQDMSYSLTIADLPITVTTVSKVITELSHVDKIIKYNNLNDHARARRNYKAASELVTMIETVQAEAILVGNDPAAQFDLTGVAIRANYNKNANTIDFSAGTLNHNYYPIGVPGTWTISAGNFASLTPATAYYVYIKASKSAATAVFYLSSTKIGVEDVSGYYHFPLGLLSSVIDGARVFTSTKGYTLITGDSIRTGRISSNDGTRYFDLATGEFKGDFKFTSGTSVETAITETGESAVNTALEYGTGKNILPDSEFAGGLQGWSFAYTSAAFADVVKGLNWNSDWSLNGNTDAYNTQGLNTLFFRQESGYIDSEHQYFMYKGLSGIQGGKKYIASAYVGNHRAIKVDMYINFQNSNGSFVGWSEIQATAVCVNYEASGGVNINGYKRIYLATTAPQDATQATLIIRKFGTVQGQSNSYMFLCRPMLEQVDSRTTKPGPWSPYASSGSTAAVKVAAEQDATSKAEAARLAAADDATNKVNAIQIGGVNTYSKTIPLNKITTNGTVNRLGDYEWQLVGSNSDQNVAFRISNVITSNGWWTISFDIRGSQGGEYPLLVDVCDNHAGTALTNSDDQYRRVSFSVLITNYTAALYNFVDFKCPAWVYYYVRNIQVEHGNKATAYKKSQQDIDEKITALDYLKAALTGSTEISGGLVGTNVILLKTLAGLITGGMSGLSNDNIGIWTGGTYQNAIDSLAKIILRKDGSGQLAGGKIFWDLLGALNVGIFQVRDDRVVVTGEDGSIVITPKEVGQVKSTASTYSGSSGYTQLGGYHTNPIVFGDKYIINEVSSINSEESESKVSISYGIHSHVDAYSYDNSSSLASYLHFQPIIEILNDSNDVIGMSFLPAHGVSAFADGEYGSDSTAFDDNSSVVINCTIPAGSFKVRLALTGGDNYFNGTGDINGSSTVGSSMSFTAVSTTKETIIGSDGLYVRLDSSNELLIKKDSVSNKIAVSSKGASFDIPAGLGGGKVASGGGLSAPWGAKPPTGCTGTTTKTITHNIGDTDYTLMVTMTSNNTYYITGRSSTQIQVVTSGSFEFVFLRTK